MCTDQREVRTIVRLISASCSGNRDGSGLVKERELRSEIVKIKVSTRASHPVEDIKKDSFLGGKKINLEQCL